MAIDSRDRRAAGVGYAVPFSSTLPAADTSAGDLEDRQIVTFGYPILDAAAAFVEPHQYLYWSGTQITESDQKYLALVDGVADPAAVSGYVIAYIDTDGNLRFLDGSGNDKTVVTSEGVITSSATVANTVTETTVYTESIPANELHVGRVVKVRILGRYSVANGTDTFSARLKIGGTTIDTITSDTGVVTDGPFDVEFMFTVRSVGASGSVWGYVSAEFNNVAKSVADTAATTIDTTAADDVTLTIQWDNALSGNSVSIDQGFTELLG